MADHVFRGLEAECLDCGLGPAAHPLPPALDGQSSRVPREELIEFVRSIAEYDRYMAFEVLKGATDSEAQLHGLKFDHEVLEAIERLANKLYNKLKEGHEL
jgi:hypothetical protein